MAGQYKNSSSADQAGKANVMLFVAVHADGTKTDNLTQ